MVPACRKRSGRLRSHLDLGAMDSEAANGGIALLRIFVLWYSDCEGLCAVCLVLCGSRSACGAFGDTGNLANGERDVQDVSHTFLITVNTSSTAVPGLFSRVPQN